MGLIEAVALTIGGQLVTVISLAKAKKYGNAVLSGHLASSTLACFAAVIQQRAELAIDELLRADARSLPKPPNTQHDRQDIRELWPAAVSDPITLNNIPAATQRTILGQICRYDLQQALPIKCYSIARPEHSLTARRGLA